MALGTQFQQVVEMVRDEAGLSSATSKGIDHLPHIERLIRRYHNMLLAEHEWRHMKLARGSANVVTAPGQRYYDWPELLDTQRPFKVWVKWGGDWELACQGITPAEYNIHDSEGDVRSDPVERWEWSGAGQFEVWPVPATAYDLTFEGVRLGNALVEQDAPLDLDGEMIALFVAAEILEEKNQKVSALKRGQANRMLGRLRGGSASDSRVVIGGSDPTASKRSGKIFIRSGRRD